MPPSYLLIHQGTKKKFEQKMKLTTRTTLETLAVNNRGTALVVFLLRDPHLLEGGQRGQDGTTNPHRVFTLRRSNDLNLHRRGGEGGDFLLHTVGNTGVHGGTTRLVSLVLCHIEGKKKGRGKHTMTMLP